MALFTSLSSFLRAYVKTKMEKESFKNIFNTYFHDIYLFDECLSIDVSKEYTKYGQEFHSKNTYSPSKKLKKIQQFLNLFIFDFLNINKDIVFSYRKGVNIVDAIQPHKQHKFIFTTDIKSFFSNINVHNIKNIILENKENYPINANDIDKYIDNIVSLVTYNNILPIGAPTSPKISNAYLLKLDNKLQEYCQNNAISYTRYSDDFIFSSKTLTKFNNFESILEKIMNENNYSDLQINHKKTKLQKQGNKISILGLIITPSGNITVNQKMKNKLEILFHFYLTDKVKFNNILSKFFSSSTEKVSGVISYINAIDKAYIIKLRKKYGNYLVSSFIHRDITN